MLNKYRVRLQSESGFTLIELLVVMLIIGLLAAIAIPAFFNQRDKARDAEAKSVAKTAQTATETYSTDKNGSYTGASLATVDDIEPTLTGQAVTVTPTAAGDGYTIVSTSDSGTTFTITRANTGALSYPCSAGGKGGCPDDGTAGGPGAWG
jgi:type IV pilus assembly protein PilA